MARSNRATEPQRVTFQQTTTAEDPEILPPPGADDDQERAFDALRATSDQTEQLLTLWVYMLPTDRAGHQVSGAKYELLFTAPIDRYTLPEVFDLVRDQYMEPTDRRWTIRVMARDESGIRYNRLFVVRSAPGASRGAPLRGAPATAVSEIMGEVRAMLEAQQQRYDQVLSRLAERAHPSPEAIGGKDLITLMMGMQQESMRTLAALLGAMKGSGSGEGVGGLVDAMLKLRRLTNENSAGAEDEGSAASTLRAIAPMGTEFLGLLRDAAARGSAAPAPRQLPHQLPAPRAPAAPAAGSAPAAAPSPSASGAPVNPQPKTENPMLAMLRAQLETLCRMATENPTPEAARTCAPVVMKAIPEEYDDQLYDLLEPADWLQRLALIYPPVSSHGAWFTALRDEMLKAYQDPDAPAQPSS